MKSSLTFITSLCLYSIQSVTPFISCQVHHLNHLLSHIYSSKHPKDIEPDVKNNVGGIYRPFAEYAWNKLLESKLVKENEIPDGLAFNTAPAKGSPPGSVVNIEVRSSSGASSSSPIRLGRFALLETLLDEKEMVSVPNAIHVLNLVIFPSAIAQLPLPILGIDLVTLPGMKHLIAIDFQPILPPSDNHVDQILIPRVGQYPRFEIELERLHKKHVLNNRDVLPSGGNIPPQASRFFSKYALWTRLQGDDAIEVIHTVVFDAFKAYLNLYLKMIMEVANDPDINFIDDIDGENIAVEGVREYLNYRRVNDPARPMLTRLFGQDYTEDLICKVLFEMN